MTESSRWISDTSLECMLTFGALGSRMLTVTVAGAAGSLSSTLSTALNSASVLVKANAATTGSASVSLYGAGFGVSRY